MDSLITLPDCLNVTLLPGHKDKLEPTLSFCYCIRARFLYKVPPSSLNLPPLASRASRRRAPPPAQRIRFAVKGELQQEGRGYIYLCHDDALLARNCEAQPQYKLYTFFPRRGYYASVWHDFRGVILGNNSNDLESMIFMKYLLT